VDELTTNIAKKSGTPIVFYHRRSFYRYHGRDYDSIGFLNVALYQARLAAPNSEIILLTDETRPLQLDVKQAMIDEYSESAEDFEKDYVHLSVLPFEDFELNCYLRWFVMRDFTRRHAIQSFCYFDSDILLFAPVERFASEFRGYIAGNWSWANFVSQPEAIDLLCDYLHNTFRHRDQLYALAERNRYLHGRADVNDMRMLFELPKSNGDILDQKDFPWKGFDHSIRESEEGLYTMDGGIKLLTRGDHGMWVAHRNRDGVEVPFYFLHFQGWSKFLMARFAWKLQAGSQSIYDVPRNAPCPCMSGKRWKQCHGRMTWGPVKSQWVESNL
jgi:hypothetical protein